MLKFNRKFKKLVIPVGLNPSYHIDSSTLYNTSDATATANDIIIGKISYNSDGKIVGTLVIDDLIEESYNEGINEQKSKLESITITENGSYSREDGYNEVIVDVPDLNGNYDEGYSEGVTVGREEIISEQSDATITPQTVFKGEIGYGANNEKIVGEYEYVDGFDFGKIGYSQELSNELNRETTEKLAYSKQLLDEWDPNITNASRYFQGNTSLVYAPLFDTSNVTNMYYMFYDCSNLTTVPQFDTSNVTNMTNMFGYCSNLTTVPLFDTSNVTNMYSMFYSCSKLTTVPEFNTSNVTNMYAMFQYCKNLTSVPVLDISKITSMEYMFYECSNLTSIPLFDTSNITIMQNTFGSCNLTEFPSLNTINVTNIDGFIRGNKNLKTIHSLNLKSVNNTGGLGTWNGFNSLKSLEDVVALNNFGQGFSGTSNNGMTLTSSTKLTRQSCLNIFNTIYDMTLNTSYTGTPTIQLSSTTKALLSDDDIAIATSKGWTIQ